jgi:hypothetical protein
MPDLEEKPGLLSLPYMVRWFRPTLLANAAIRAAVSPVFGTYADARSVHANVDGFSEDQLAEVAHRYDLSEIGIADAVGAVWVDYLADTGDGFDSSYAMASLVAQDSLTLARRGSTEKVTLPAGKVLILGGDQVYPFPSRKEYQERFVYPFKMAFSAPAQERLTFVIPGNHDWYDGLNSFDYLFCQARYGRTDGSRLGSLTFSQHRSYFAIRLPYNWWIWGADIQFSDYLDAGQLRYFQSVAELMRPRDGEVEHKVILCIAAPGWQYEEREARAANSNTRLIAGIVEDAGAKVCAVLSGDAHHYSRYYSRRLGLNLVTAGGGGAFLHPTHQLHDDIEYRWQGENHRFHLYCRPAVEGSRRTYEPAVFPSRLKSHFLTWGNMLFPIWNYTFATLLGTFYWLMTWMYSQTPINNRENCRINGEVESRPLVEDLLVYNSSECPLVGETWAAKIPDLVTISLQAGIYQFLLGIYGLGLLIVLIMYADARSRWKRVVMGTAHWFAHIIAMVTLYLVVNHYGYWEWFGEATVAGLTPLLPESAKGSVNMLRTVAYMVQMIMGGGLVAGFVWGIYLFFACAFFRRHWNDAFSSLRNPDYKNFLRMKIEPDKLTIYPVGLTRTPTRVEWRDSSTRPGVWEPRTPLAPELIDGPVVIESAKVRHRPEQPGGSA